MRLLLIEDDTLIRLSVAFGLEDLGFVVVEAACGEDALACIATQGFDVVVTDVDLGPGISGLELADRVRERWPSLPVVFVTGGLKALAGRRLVPHEAFLAKPYDVSQLAAVANRLGHLAQA